MKIGDEVYVHGYIDEIRYDDTKRVSTIIIRNDGGYFGTVPSEIDRKTEPQTDIHDLTDCDFCKDRNCKDCEGGKDEPQTERSE